MKSWVLWWLLPATLAATDIVRTFAPNATANFSHLAVDPLTGRVYLGGSNWLFQFGPDLGLEAAVKTGPVRDSVLCFPTDCSGQVLAPYNNVNKLLVLDPAERKLIVCGSVHQGACRRHRLDNISHFEDLIPVPVAANDENSSTFGFIGPARYPGGGSPSRVLYVATTNSRLGPYRDMVPAICSRSLEQGRLFTVVEHSFSSISRVDVSFHLRDYYLVHYIYGFHAGDFVYFASVQRKSHLRALEEWGYVTRLARVCTQDSGYNTYAEVTLQCLGAEVDYNLLQGAVLVPAAAELAADLRLEPGTPVLVGVFAASRDHTYRASARSALCVFPLPEIEQKFTENIHMCYNGSVLTRDMDYIAGSINQCPEPGKAGNVINFCNETVKLNGSVPISAFASAEFPNTTATGVAASVIGHLHNLAVVATDRGEIRKLLLNRASEAEEFETVPVAPGEKILPDLYIDSSQQYLIAATQRTVYKVRLEGCHRYSDCDQCLQAKNPYCGWCSLEKKSVAAYLSSPPFLLLPSL
ncbi:hypothetical protein LAZ67_2003075 [Cordylochernes scorpioides]|uniref:Sema domain-containing protein n=1 Tax=Cordylochernes scorpioides TaxID=51811 RepID=A0ABY6K2K7_9ARAC|nr:hypothetical protein LAZ67_2003075 [Cordylochernes scorpioides]